MAQQKFNAVEGFSVGSPGNVISVVDSNANVYANRVFVQQYANLGDVGNIYIGGGFNNQVLKTDGTGNLYWSQDSAPAGGSNTQIQFNNNGGLDGSAAFVFNNASNVVTISGNLITGNADLGNVVTANYFSGNGIYLSSITGANVTGTVASATLASTVTTGAQPNITSFGTLQSVTFAANSNVSLSGELSQVFGANLVSANYLTGTLTTQTQTNITSVGTLTSLNVSGNITSANASLGNLVTANYFSGNASLLTGTINNANYAAYAGNITIGDQPNITSVGILTSVSVSGVTTATGGIETANIYDADGTLTLQTKYNTNSGDVGIVGNLTVGTTTPGNLTVNGVSDLGPVGNVKIEGGSANYVLKTDGAGSLSWVSPVSQVISGSNTQIQFNDNGVFGSDANFTYDKATDILGVKYIAVESTGNIIGGNLVSATYLTGTLTTQAQPNITSVGVLQNTTFASNATIEMSGILSQLTGGNLVSATYIAGTLTSSAQPNITSVGTLVDTTMGSANSLTGGNLVSATYLTGTLTTQEQPNITSVGTLSTLNVIGNVTSGNAILGNLATANYFSGNGSLLSHINGSNVDGQVANALIAGTVYANAQPNITSVGTLIDLNVTGNITSAYFVGDGSQLTNVDGSQVSNVANANYASFAGIVITSAQPNITSVGTLVDANVSGNVLIGGNLIVNGTTVYTNVDTFSVEDPIIDQGNGPNNTPLTNNDGKDRGTLLHYYTTQPVDAFMGWDNSNGEFAFGSNVSVTNDIATFNAFGNVRAGYFIGNGSQLTGIIGTSNYAAYAGNVTIGAQPNITSVGTLVDTTMGASNSLTGGNLVSATYIAGTLTTKVQPNITSLGTLVDTTMGSANSLTGGNLVSATYLTGTLTTKVQPNITSVGTLVDTTMGSANSLTGGNLVSATYLTGTLTTKVQPNITSLGTLVDTTMGSANSLTGGNLVSATYLTGTLTTQEQPNITSVGTLSSLSISGNLTSGNANLGRLATATYFAGDGSLLTNLTAGTQIINGTSNVKIPSTNSNVNISVNGVANVVQIGSTSVTVTGDLYRDGKQVPSYVSSSTVPTNPRLGDQWYNQTNDVTYQYIYDGVSYFWVDVSSGYIASNVSATANTLVLRNQFGNVYANGLFANAISVSGNVSGTYFIGDGSLLTGITGVGGYSNANVAAYLPTYTGNFTAGNISSTGNITASYFIGNGSQLTGLPASYANSNVAAYLPTYSGNFTAGNISSTGNITASYFIGNGSQLTGLPASYSNANVAAYLPTYTGNVAANYFIGNGSQLTNINGSNVNGQVSNALVAGTVYSNAQPNITSLGTLASLDISGDIVSGSGSGGNITGANVISANFFIGNGSQLTGLNASNIASGTISSSILGNSSLYVGTTSIALNRASGAQTLTGITSIDGYASTVSASAQPNITSVGILSTVSVSGTATVGNLNTTDANVYGNILVAGNLIVNGTTEYNNVTNLYVKDPIIEMGGGANNAVLTNNDGLDRGTLLHYYTTEPVNAFMGWKNTTGEFIFSSNASITGNVVSVNSYGNVHANYYIGNGSLLTGLPTQYANSNVAAYLPTYTGNFTAGNGEISGSLVVNGTLSAGGGTGGSISGANVISANYFIGNGSQLTGLPASYANSNVAAYLPTYSGNISAGNITATSTIKSSEFESTNSVGDEGGEIRLALAQTNTTLTSGVTIDVYQNKLRFFETGGTTRGAYIDLSVASAGVGSDLLAGSGGGSYSNANAAAYLSSYTGNFSAGNITATGNITGTYIIGNGSQLTGLPASYANSNVAAYLPTYTGNIAATYFIGNGSTLTNITGGNIDGQVANALVAGTVYTNAQPNITSVGTLIDLNVAGNITASYLIGNGSQLTGLPASYANSNVAAYLPTYTGNFTAGNGEISGSLVVNGTLSAGGGTGGSISGANVISANYFIGNGSQLTGLPTQYSNANVAAYLPTYTGTFGSLSTLAITGLTTATGGVKTPNIVDVSGTATIFTKYNGVSGDAGIVGNLVVGTSGTGNVTATYFIGNGSQLTGLPTQYSNANVAAYLPTYTGEFSVANVTATGNITAAYLVGDGGYLSNIQVAAGTSIVNGTSNVAVGSSGNVTVSVAGVSNTVIFTSSGANVAGYLNATGNITASYFVGDGSQLTGLPASYSNANVAAYLPTYTGNFSAGNITATGNVIANVLFANTIVGPSSANVSITAGAFVSTFDDTGNITLSDNVSVAGNLSAAYFIGNGSQLTGLPSQYANSNVAAYLPTYTGEFSVANISATGNITAAYFIGNGSQLTSITGENVTGQVANASVASAVYSNAQPNITSVGTLTSLSVTNTVTAGNVTTTGDVSATNLSLNGNAIISGNLIVSGSTEYTNVTNLYITDPIISLGGGANNTALTTNDGKDRGTLLRYYTTQPVDAFMGWDNSNGEFAFGSNVSNSSEVITFNSFGNVRAGYFIGDGSALTNITGGNVDGQVANALVAGTVYTAAQPNITSVGTLTSLTVGGDITVSNVSATGNVTATYFIGNGSQLTGLPASYSNSNVTAYLLTNTSDIAAGNIDVTGNITASYFIGNGSQLTGLPTQYSNANVAAYLPTYTGNISAGNVSATGNITAGSITTSGSGGNISGANYITANFFVGDGSLLTGITGGDYSNSNVAAYLPTYTGEFSVGNITSTGNITASYLIGNGSQLTGLPTQYANSNVAAYLPTYSGEFSVANINATGNITASYLIGNGSQLTNITGGNVDGQVANALVASTVYSNAQPNITSIGTLSALTLNGLGTLGSVGNIKITGGSAGYLLSTDGTGNLSWATGSGGGVSSVISIVKDRFLASGSSNTFTLSTTPSSTNTMEVVIDGLQQISNTYSVAGTTLSFPTNPAAGQVIEVTTFGTASLSGSAGEIQYNTGDAFGSSSAFTFDASSNTLATGSVAFTNGLTSNRANVTVTTNTVVDEFDPSVYRSAKYVFSASGSGGYQTAEAVLVHDDTSSFISIYGSICSNATVDTVEFSSNINGTSGNVTVYATASGTSTILNLVATYLKT